VRSFVRLTIRTAVPVDEDSTVQVAFAEALRSMHQLGTITSLAFDFVAGDPYALIASVGVDDHPIAVHAIRAAISSSKRLAELVTDVESSVETLT
jgi:hypothetical protein